MKKGKFLSKFRKTDSCWLWTEYVRADGYAYVRVGDRKLRAHRVSYELFVGPIPEGLELDHLCRVRHCVNPEHLEPVTHEENVRRRIEHMHKDKGHKPVWAYLKQGRICSFCRTQGRKLNNNWRPV